MKRTFALVAICAALLMLLFAVRPSRPSAANLDSCPITLTNPDGQALTLVKYDLRAAVHGALSLVEMEMTFRNPENRQMEGRFVYTLPPAATISRFAKEVNGKLMEGEVVERMRAQSIYTEILHTMRDPALLESDQGNRFSARVFPVPANGTVRLLLAFSQPLPMREGVRKLRIPLAGLPKIGEFNFRAIGRPLESETGTGVVLDKEEPMGEDLSGFSRHSTDYTPTKDIELTFKAATDKPLRALKSGNFQMVQFLYNPTDVQKIAPPTDWSYYFDTSASGADTEAPRLQVIGRLVEKMQSVIMEQNTTFQAHAFDIDIAELCKPVAISGMANRNPSMPDIEYKLRSRHALGATNLEAVLKHIGDAARANPKATTYVLVSDGIVTWGKREVNDLLTALGEWPAKDTLHALVIGNKQDDKVLNGIVEKTRGRIVTLPLSTNVVENVSKAIADLRAPLGAHFDAYDEGTAWIFPKSFHDVRPGTELIAFSEIKAGGKSLPGFVQRDAAGKSVKDTQVSITPIEVKDFAPLLQREAYKNYLDFLEKQEQAEKDAMKRAEIHKQRIDISVKNRVMCSLTSLLVLETERDYQRFGIARTALADVMTVGLGGIELLKRTGDEIPIPVTPPMVGKPKENARNSGAKKALDAKSEDSPAAGERLRKSGDAKADVSDLSTDDLKDGGVNRLGRQLAQETAVEAVEQLAEGEGRAVARGGAVRLSSATAAAPHPFAPTGDAHPTPDAAPRQAQDRAGVANVNAVEESTRGRRISPPNSPPAPTTESRRTEVRAVVEWTLQAKDVTSDAAMSEFRSKIQANPHDRKLRNAYADALLKAKKFDNLQAEVFQWLPFDPENPAVYEFLGKSATGLNDATMALRAYSSIAEIAPNRAALLSRAGFLLLEAKKYALAESMFREALKNRQDDCNIHRGLALSLWLAGNMEAASVAYETALMKDYNPRYGDAKRVLREEFGYVLRAWRKKDAANSDELVARAARANVDLLRSDALRVTMCWETDANDVDLHVVDPNGEECFYQHKNNASGLELYSDQTQGLGPEVVRTSKALPGTYNIGVNYFSAGPMGVSRGVVVVFKPTDGVENAPQIIPFALIEGGKDLRWVGAVSY
ncbi:MAG: VIT domain-containing protein [Planctomycetota bacterium]